MTSIRQLLPIPLPIAFGGTGSTTGVPTPANPTATAGPTVVNGTAATFMRSDAAPAIQKASNAVFGIVEVDNATIISTAGVISSPSANPSATASDVAVNGTSANFMRADASPAVQKTSASVFGLAKVDGTTITAAAGVISAVVPTLPISPTNGGKPSNRFTNFTNTTPFTTSSSTPVQCGFGASWHITPATTGNIRIKVTGTVTIATNNGTVVLQNGTGTAPTAGAAATGTSSPTSTYAVGQVGSTIGSQFISIETELTGKTLGTAIWFDLAISVNAANITLLPISVIIEEF